MSPLKVFIAIIIIAAAIAICYVALPAMGVAVPSAIVNILWIVLIAVVAVLALIFIFKWWNTLP